MKLELMDEGEHFSDRNPKKPPVAARNKNPWKGAFDRRRKPREGDEIFNITLAQNNASDQQSD